MFPDGPGPPRDARRQYGDGDKRDVGCCAGSGRPYRGDRRRRRRLPCRCARGAVAGRRGRADRYRSEPWSDRRGLGLPSCDSGEGFPRGRSGRPRERITHGAGYRTDDRRLRSDRPRIELGRHPNVPLELGGAFHSRRLTLRSSQVGALPASRRQRWSLRRRLILALSLLRDPVFNILLSGETEFAELPAMMPRLAASSVGILCHTLRYD